MLLIDLSSYGACNAVYSCNKRIRIRQWYATLKEILKIGFEGVKMKGSEHNDVFYKDMDDKIKCKTNFAGGVLGGITNGSNIVLKT